jgi:protein TonB
MKNGRNPEFDLEKRRPGITLFSFLVPLALTLVAFEWTSWDVLSKTVVCDFPDDLFIEEELVPPVPKPPAPSGPMEAKPIMAPPTIIEIIDGPVIDDPTLAAVPDPIDPQTYPEPLAQRIEPVDEEKLFERVEQMPQFQGGDAGLFSYLGRNIKYPELAREVGIQGIVYITFEVDKEGNVKDAKVLRGIGGGCDEEALRVVKAMPPWEPGKQRGKAVRVQYTLPVKFRLVN